MIEIPTLTFHRVDYKREDFQYTDTAVNDTSFFIFIYFLSMSESKEAPHCIVSYL